MNTDELALSVYRAQRRLLEIQTKLHRWSSDDPIAGSMICTISSPILRSCWWRGIGCGTTGARAQPEWTGETAHYIEAVRGLEGFLADLRNDLKARTFQPLPVRRRAIPKAGGKVRYLGIATIRDRVAQASLKLVLEPIFEADFLSRRGPWPSARGPLVDAAPVATRCLTSSLVG